MMKSVQVIFPVLRGSRRFFVEKGPRWSVIEHLLLDAVCGEPRSAAELAEKSQLPRRVIVEAFIRLMRLSWVEIVGTPAGPKFRATPRGALQAPLDQLPAQTVTKPVWRAFAIEQVIGGVFRRTELDVRPQSKLPVSADNQLVIHMPATPLLESGDLSDVFAAIEGEDEVIVGVDQSGPERLTKQYAVVTVRDSAIEGLPLRASAALRTRILEAAQKKREESEIETAKAEHERAPAVPTPIEAPKIYDAHFELEDLIIDGDAHIKALEHVLKRASERVIVHSTFITEARALALLPSLLQAAANGAKIDILWGQDDVGGKTTSSQAAAAKLQSAVAEAGRSTAITVHPFSTNSHAKVVVADNGRGGWSAIVGSCNWLASDFASFEASVRLREPAMIGVLICKLARLTRGRPGLWHDLAVEMTILGRRVGQMARSNGRKVPMRFLLAPDHARLALEARDRAVKRIFVLSHRIGIAGRPVAIEPIRAAAAAGDLEAVLYYGRTTGPLSGSDGAELTRELSDHGLTLRPIHRPRLHAKVLGWDDSALAISSLNWLSADPPDGADYRELGVLIEAPRVADYFISRFEHARLA